MTRFIRTRNRPKPARMFETFILDIENENDPEQLIDHLRSKIYVHKVFSPEVLMNHDIFAKINEQLTGMQLKPDPPLRANTRHP